MAMATGLVMAQGATSTEGFSNLASRNGMSAQYPIMVTTYDTSDPKDASKILIDRLPGVWTGI